MFYKIVANLSKIFQYVYWEKEKAMCKCSHAIQAHIVQGLTVYLLLIIHSVG